LCFFRSAPVGDPARSTLYTADADADADADAERSSAANACF